MKKFVSLLAVAVLLVVTCCAYLPTVAVGQTTIVVESKTCEAGDTVSVAVQVQNNAGFMYLEMTPTYPDGWQMTAQNGDLVSDMTKGKQLVWVADEDVTDNGLLATLTFTVPETAEPGNYAIGFTVRGCYNYDEEDVAVNIVAGTVTVQGEEPAVQDPTEPFAQLKKDVTFASETGAIRFVAAINSLQHQKAGLILSLSNSEPTVGGNASTVYETNTVYTSVFAGEETVSAAQLGGEYAYAVTLNNIPKAHFGTTVYVRAFVVTEQGEYQYSVVKAYSVSQLLGGLQSGGSSNGGTVDFGGIN